MYLDDDITLQGVKKLKVRARRLISNRKTLTLKVKLLDLSVFLVYVLVWLVLGAGLCVGVVGLSAGLCVFWFLCKCFNTRNTFVNLD